MDFLTKFRAFQLGSPGSLFTFYKPGQYTLIEARLPMRGLEVLLEDLAWHNISRISTLHITSWDTDHCNYDDLTKILNFLRPELIEIPGYPPESKEGELCYNVITEYDHIHQRNVHNVRTVNSNYINSLTPGLQWETNDVAYHSMYDCDNKNDMSLIRLFRSAGFCVLSTGDCESPETADRLINCGIIQKEVDLLILSHHGANNGFTTGRLLDIIQPKIAICSSNYDNMFDHPRQEIRNLLSSKNIPLMTTKRGDAIIYQMNDIAGAIASNMSGNNEIVESRISIIPKKINRLQVA
jgi:competence protein ComEC